MTMMDGYIRVSRRGGREGESYRSPEIQRDEIQRWARNNGVTLGKVVTEEDVSGAKAVADRKLQGLLKRVEDGVSAGIVVYNTSRFARDTIETLVAAKRIKDAGARLVGVADGVDSDQPNGKMYLALMASMAEQHLDQIKANWDAATSRAVESGIHIACKAPVGYLRADEANPVHDSAGELVRDGRLVVDPDTAPAVRKAFELRAEGASLAKVTDFLIAELDRGFSRTGVSGILKNRAYLGEARGPKGAVKKDAHEALITEDLFARVQARAGTFHPRNGELTKQALLAGLVTCGSCGHKMGLRGGTHPKTGERLASYACSAKFASGDCPAPAIARTSVVDEHVLTLLQDDQEAIAAGALSIEQRYLAAREAVREAEEALDAWVDDPAIASSLGHERFQRGLLKRQEALDEARRRMWEVDIDDADAPNDDATVLWIDGKPVVYEVWGEDPEADRRHLRRYISSVTIDRADPKRRKWQPIEERVAVKWVGEDDD